MPSTPQPTDAPAQTESDLDVCLKELPNQYEILGKVNEGGMGHIFRAQNRFTGAQVAIKVLRVEAVRDRNALERFINEAKAASSLRHPNICQVHDFGQTKSGMPYLVMDWIDGISLNQKVKRDSRLSANEAIPVFQQIAMALDEAHKHRVVHRDLKPENIMLTRDTQGRTHVKVVDFGIAKVLADDEQTPVAVNLTRTGTVVGTPMYMSPEQARGLQIDCRTDVYSFGCLMYFAIVGEPPFVGPTVIDTLNKHLYDPPAEIDSAIKIPADLKMLMLKCMEKKVKHRYQSMDELARELKKLSKGVDLDKHVLSTERDARRKKIMLFIYFVVGFVLMYILSNVLQGLMDAHH